MNAMTVLRGAWRVLLGFCPACNSDAPALDTCRVCRGWRGPYPPSKFLTFRWWCRWRRPEVPFATRLRRTREEAFKGGLNRGQQAARVLRAERDLLLQFLEAVNEKSPGVLGLPRICLRCSKLCEGGGIVFYTGKVGLLCARCRRELEDRAVPWWNG